MRILRTPRSRSDRGAVAVEFALIVPFMLLLIFGVIQYGWYFYAMQSGTAAVGDAGRRLSVGGCQGATERNAFIKQKLGGALASGSAVSSTVVYKTPSGGTSPSPVIGGSVEITATYRTMDLNFPFLPVPADGEITRSTYARVEYDGPPVGGC